MSPGMQTRSYLLTSNGKHAGANETTGHRTCQDSMRQQEAMSTDIPGNNPVQQASTHNLYQKASISRACRRLRSATSAEHRSVGRHQGRNPSTLPTDTATVPRWGRGMLLETDNAKEAGRRSPSGALVGLPNLSKDSGE